MSWGYEWRPYVSVGERRRQARQEMARLRKKGADIQPVENVGRKIAESFWGAAWCEHLESFSDYENRLPRGRAYVRNGSVCHLAISPGKIEAKVSGSELYTVRIEIKKLAATKWRAIKQRCAGQIGSLLDLLRGKLSDSVMAVVSDREHGLFPLPREISLDCSCPDWATMCKHVAAVLYGVGARLDQRPELLFVLRGVDHEELIAADAAAAVAAATGKGRKRRVADSQLEDIFGIELADATQQRVTAAPDQVPASPAAKQRAPAGAPKRSRARTKSVQPPAPRAEDPQPAPVTRGRRKVASQAASKPSATRGKAGPKPSRPAQKKPARAAKRRSARKTSS